MDAETLTRLEEVAEWVIDNLPLPEKLINDICLN